MVYFRNGKKYFLVLAPTILTSEENFFWFALKHSYYLALN